MSESAVLQNNLPALSDLVAVSLDVDVGAGDGPAGTLVIGSETLSVISGAGGRFLVCNRGETPTAHVVGDSATYTSPAPALGIPEGGPLTEDLDAGGFKVTGLGAPSDPADAARLEDLPATPGLSDVTAVDADPGATMFSKDSGAPGGTLTTFLYFDTTASTGGLYAWDGSAYQKVGLATT